MSESFSDTGASFPEWEFAENTFYSFRSSTENGAKTFSIITFSIMTLSISPIILLSA
jgi:hypothetical protein